MPCLLPGCHPRPGDLVLTLLSVDASFRTDESTRRYIDTAIAQNIQRSLRCFKDGSRFFSLRELYEAGELTNAINRIIEDMNHGFLVDVVTRRSDGSDDVPRTIFTQPGMRYCQAQALVFALGADSRMRQFGDGIMSRACETILNDVRGRMLEDIVLYETTRSLVRQGVGLTRPSAFKVLFPSGEFDMVVTGRSWRRLPPCPMW